MITNFGINKEEFEKNKETYLFEKNREAYQLEMIKKAYRMHYFPQKSQISNTKTSLSHPPTLPKKTRKLFFIFSNFYHISKSKILIIIKFSSPNTHRPLPPMPRPASHPAAGPRRVPLISFCLAIHARSRLARRAAASRCTRRGRPLPEGCWSTTFPPSCPSTLSQAGPRFPSGTCSHHISPKCYTLALSDSQ